MGKSGPKGNHFEYQGERVVGLRRDKKSGRLFPVGKGSPSFGSEPRSAIHRFRLWQAEQSDEVCTINEFVAMSDVEKQVHVSRDRMKPHDGPPTNVRISGEQLQMILDDERERIRNLIYSSPKQAATELDCEPIALLANVEDLKPPQPSKRLTELCDTYLDDKTLSPKEATNSRTWWDEFRTITGAKTVTDLDRRAFKTYRKTIKARQGDLSNVWVRSRFGKIKTIVNHATVEMELTDREKRILSDVVLLKQPPKPTPKPVDISPKQMKAILKAADKWDKALILLALNSAYLPKDCQRLKWDMVNFENETIRFDRTKSEKLARKPLPRICSLWKRTIRALEAIKNGHANVFVSTQGQPAHIDTINDHFVDCCEEAGLTKNFTFKHLRKSALTAASNDPSVPDRQIKLLAGHSAGIKEHYVVRRNVQLACEAIERCYFGKRS